MHSKKDVENGNFGQCTIRATVKAFSSPSLESHFLVVLVGAEFHRLLQSASSVCPTGLEHTTKEERIFGDRALNLGAVLAFRLASGERGDEGVRGPLVLQRMSILMRCPGAFRDMDEATSCNRGFLADYVVLSKDFAD